MPFGFQLQDAVIAHRQTKVMEECDQILRPCKGVDFESDVETVVAPLSVVHVPNLL